MPQPNEDNFETRLTNVEREVALLRERTVMANTDAGAARVLAAGADHDVAEVRAELRAHTQALNALRETQLEHHAESRERFAQVDRNFAKVEDNFAKVNTGLAHITTLIEGISSAN